MEQKRGHGSKAGIERLLTAEMRLLRNVGGRADKIQ